MAKKENVHCDRCGKLCCTDIEGKAIIEDDGWQSIRLRLPIQDSPEAYTHFCGKCYEAYYTSMFQFLKPVKEPKLKIIKPTSGKKTQDFYHGKID